MTLDNAYAERFVLSIKESCLDRMILFAERSLRRAVQEFVAHYHFERNHQGLDNQLCFPIEPICGRAQRSNVGGVWEGC